MRSARDRALLGAAFVGAALVIFWIVARAFHAGAPHSQPPREPDAPALVASLSEVDFSHGPLTQSQASFWRANLQKLAKQGTVAVPAIREFLAKNVDLDFDPKNGGDMLGFSTLPLAFFDVLRQIEPSATAWALELLHTTADPGEIAVLSKYLEQSVPGH